MLLTLEARLLGQLFAELLCTLIEDVSAVRSDICESWALRTLGPLHGGCGERTDGGAGGGRSEGGGPLYETTREHGGGKSAGMQCWVCCGVSEVSLFFQAIEELARVRYICCRGLGANQRAARYKLSLAKLRGSRVQVTETARVGPAVFDQVSSGDSFRGWVGLARRSGVS
jgi:hypothetical protein